MRLRSAFVAVSLAAATAVSITQVYEAYQPGQPECYRQPILLSVQPAGTLLALAEGRTINDYDFCAGTEWPDVVDFPIVVKRSTDYGATWGPTITITHGNLDFLTSVYDPATGIVHLMIQLGDDGVIYTTSPDGGVTWTPPANITISGDFASIIPGVGHGLVVDPRYCMDPTCAGTAGRLLMPWACTVEGPVSNDTACSNCRTCLLASDDNGAGWYLAAVSSQVGGRESALVQLNSADFSTMGAVVYASERNLGPTPGVRLHAVSLNGGESFDSRYYAVDNSLPDVLTANWTGVVSGLARVSTPSAPDFLVFTAPYNNASERVNLTAFVSSGVGPAATWSVSAIGSLWSADAAYSDALQINETHVGVLFECGSNGDFAAQIAFAAVPIESLL